MAKGDIYPSEKRTFIEPSTGVRVVQLTDQPCHHANPYYNQEGFIGGAERYVFRSNRSDAVSGELYMVEVATGRIVQLTDAGRSGARRVSSHGSSGITTDPCRGIVYFSRDRQIIGLDVETLDERIVAESPPGCTGLNGLDLSSCGRYFIASCQPEGMAPHHGGIPGMRYRHGSEAMLVLVDVQENHLAIIYHGPSPENQAAPDSHAFISRDDPSYPFFGSYTRLQPSGAKTIWSMQIDPKPMQPVRDPMLLFDQRPWENVNHYYPAPNAHVESLMWVAVVHDRHGVPVGIDGHRMGMLLDVDLASGAVARWAFPGQAPVHCKCNRAGDMWTGDCADPGFLWFAGRDRACGTSAPPHHWSEADAWIGVFKKRGPYLEVRPLVRHDAEWPHVHPHPAFSPDDRWVAYRSGNRNQTQIFLAEAVWPNWFN